MIESRNIETGMRPRSTNIKVKIKGREIPLPSHDIEKHP
jgi:hypothetical protein